MHVAVILSGCGVYDGSEIHEAVFCLLGIEEMGWTYEIFAPDMTQHHVINHITGEEMPESRNVLIESARIARGNIRPLSAFDVKSADALVIPGGFGAAKNLTTWAFSGPDGDIHPEVVRAIRQMVEASKPVGAVCMGPAVVARALKDSGMHPHLTVGTTEEVSPYDIAAVNAGLQAAGSVAVNRSVREVEMDVALKIVTAPCYMMEAGVKEVKNNVFQMLQALGRL